MDPKESSFFSLCFWPINVKGPKQLVAALSHCLSGQRGGLSHLSASIPERGRPVEEPMFWELDTYVVVGNPLRLKRAEPCELLL